MREKLTPPLKLITPKPTTTTLMPSLRPMPPLKHTPPKPHRAFRAGPPIYRFFPQHQRLAIPRRHHLAMFHRRRHTCPMATPRPISGSIPWPPYTSHPVPCPPRGHHRPLPAPTVPCHPEQREGSIFIAFCLSCLLPFAFPPSAFPLNAVKEPHPAHAPAARHSLCRQGIHALLPFLFPLRRGMKKQKSHKDGSFTAFRMTRSRGQASRSGVHRASKEPRGASKGTQCPRGTQGAVWRKQGSTVSTGQARGRVKQVSAHGVHAMLSCKSQCRRAHFPFKIAP